MQRGLRMCKTSQQLWLEYFRMELMYAHKLRTRRRIMGADDSAGGLLLFLCIQHISLLHGIAAPCLPVDADKVQQIWWFSQICQALMVLHLSFPCQSCVTAHSHAATSGIIVAKNFVHADVGSVTNLNMISPFAQTSKGHEVKACRKCCLHLICLE